MNYEFKTKILINVNDYIHYNRTFSKPFQKVLRYIIITTAAFATGTLSLSLFFPGNGQKANLLVATVASVLLIVIAFLMTRFILKYYPLISNKIKDRLYEKAYKKQKNIHEEGELTINIDGIVYARPSETVSANWKQIRKVMEDDNALYVYMSAIRAFVIPKRYFESESDLSILKDFIKQQTGYKIK